MRLRDVLLPVMLVAVVGGAGCSRLTFVKPTLKRHNYQQVAPSYDVKEDPEGAERVIAIDEVALAEQSLRADQVEDAATHVAKAVKADPKSADAQTLLAMIEERRGHASEAGTHYAKAVALSPQSGNMLNNYGAWLCANGRYAESLPLFDRALADPSYATPLAALANAGSCALSSGDTARAEHDLAQVLQLDPDNALALASMAETRYRQGQYMEARAFVERRLAIPPASVKLLQLASQIEQKLGDTAAAARYVQRIETEFRQQPTGSSGGSGK